MNKRYLFVLIVPFLLSSCANSTLMHQYSNEISWEEFEKLFTDSLLSSEMTSFVLQKNQINDFVTKVSYYKQNNESYKYIKKSIYKFDAENGVFKEKSKTKTKNKENGRLFYEIEKSKSASIYQDNYDDTLTYFDMSNNCSKTYQYYIPFINTCFQKIAHTNTFTTFLQQFLDNLNNAYPDSAKYFCDSNVYTVKANFELEDSMYFAGLFQFKIDNEKLAALKKIDYIDKDSNEVMNTEYIYNVYSFEPVRLNRK